MLQFDYFFFSGGSNCAAHLADPSRWRSSEFKQISSPKVFAALDTKGLEHGLNEKVHPEWLYCSPILQLSTFSLCSAGSGKWEMFGRLSETNRQNPKTSINEVLQSRWSATVPILLLVLVSRVVHFTLQDCQWWWWLNNKALPCQQ